MNNSSINHSFQVNMVLQCYVAVSCPHSMSWRTTNCKISYHSAYQVLFLAHWKSTTPVYLAIDAFHALHYHCTSDNHQLQAMWADFCACLASYPGPAKLSVASRTVKRERAWYLFSREWRQDRKGGRKGLIVRGCTGPRTAKRAKVPGNLPHVSS